MRIKPTRQDYDAYTPEDLAVWQLLYDRQMTLLRSNASELYLEAMGHIGFNRAEIPSFVKTNDLLRAATGWQLTVAPELVPQAEFFTLLSKRVFPATCWLRYMSELDYIEEPDMFHDVFGHAPLLMNQQYANFMEGFGKLAAKWEHEPEAVKLLSRVYWFTVEYGLLMEAGEPKVFGAGIISSIGETKHALSNDNQKLSFDIATMLATDYRTDVLQQRYFIIDSFSQLCNALPFIDMVLAETLTTAGSGTIIVS